MPAIALTDPGVMYGAIVNTSIARQPVVVKPCGLVGFQQKATLL